jgi:hypothetical protein
MVVTVEFDFLDMAVLRLTLAPFQHHSLVGQEHDRTIPLADLGTRNWSNALLFITPARENIRSCTIFVMFLAKATPQARQKPVSDLYHSGAHLSTSHSVGLATIMFYQIRDGDRPGIFHDMSLATIILHQLRSDSRATDAVAECG